MYGVVNSHFTLMDCIHVHLYLQNRVLLMCSPTTGHNWKKTCAIICVLLVIVGVFGAVIGVSWWLGKS